jgi:hypothetical protein
MTILQSLSGDLSAGGLFGVLCVPVVEVFAVARSAVVVGAECFGGEGVLAAGASAGVVGGGRLSLHGEVLSLCANPQAGRSVLGFIFSKYILTRVCCLAHSFHPDSSIPPTRFLIPSYTPYVHRGVVA